MRDGDIYENYEKMKNMLQEARDVISFVGNTQKITTIMGHEDMQTKRNMMFLELSIGYKTMICKDDIQKENQVDGTIFII